MTQAERDRHRLEGELASELVQRIFDERTDVHVELADGRFVDEDDEDADPVIMLPNPAPGLPDEPWTVEVSVTLRPWFPSGWTRRPQFAKGDIVMVNGPSAHRWQVREVLGTPLDPRPGYLLDFVLSLDPFDHESTGRIALPGEVFAPIEGAPEPTKAAT